ncbi:uncharacterized protein PHALS_14684 [Plasmopara halstedii]|uniref:Uncharacterized protein n=1 Tax=Plasmopara halstedii TaxID=4781 RepID=A0A0P1ANK6_PLAHL|nr:uncharacterized protein PHALS_14684 [Plasmopara halstedii]CEG43078.1 hypothetical protein PHALS_14684 [Plasmopara halstedii]|eukprot:XP_024579447.1 hypothetical protein PHALS_14684 [Plasmopara halstedii]
MQVILADNLETKIYVHFGVVVNAGVNRRHDSRESPDLCKKRERTHLCLVVVELLHPLQLRIPVSLLFVYVSSIFSISRVKVAFIGSSD